MKTRHDSRHPKPKPNTKMAFFYHPGHVLLCLLSLFTITQSTELCPKPIECSTIPHSNSHESIHLTIESSSEETINLYWVDTTANCNEKSWGTVKPGASITVTTYPGHLWRAKSTMDESIVLEYVASLEQSTIQIPDCTRRKKIKTSTKSTQQEQQEQVALHMQALNIKKNAFPSLIPETKWLNVDQTFPKCHPQQDLGVQKVAGFYVLCAAIKPSVSSKNVKTLRIAGFRSLTAPIVMFDCPMATFNSPHGMRYCIKTGMKLKRDYSIDSVPKHLPNWVMWEANGRHKVHVASQMAPITKQTTTQATTQATTTTTTGRLFLFTGGNFIWPGIKIGNVRSVGTVAGRDKDVLLETMSLQPLVFEISNFLSIEECDHIINLAKPYMGKSVVSHMDGDEGKADTTWRTSTTHFLTRGQTNLAKNIERRIFDATRVPITHGEGTQVLRYEKWQHYYTHHDYFEPARYTNSKSTLHMIENGAKNRLATVFWYMSDVTKGGHTNFPRSGGKPRPSGNTCEQGLLVKPVKGKVIVFFNMLPDGELDDFSLHAGCNVESNDVKWSANKWLWNKPTRGLWMGEDIDMKLYELAENVPGSGAGISVDGNGGGVDRTTEDMMASVLGDVSHINWKNVTWLSWFLSNRRIFGGGVIAVVVVLLWLVVRCCGSKQRKPSKKWS